MDFGYTVYNCADVSYNSEMSLDLKINRFHIDISFEKPILQPQSRLNPYVHLTV